MIRSARCRRAAALALAAMLGLTLLAGCATSAETATPTPAADPALAEKPVAMKIGTLATEDSLPLWVAEKMGYFATQGIPSVEIVSFQSAQERNAALASGTIDAFTGDMIAAANLEASGTKVSVSAIMLGADVTQGRFAVVVPPKSTVTDLKALADVPVGSSSATIQEYVLDGLMAEAGVATSSVRTEEVEKASVRFELLMAGKLKAAALPEPFVTLAEQGGAKVLADDTKAKRNLSQTVLVISDEFLAKTGGKSTEAAVLSAWDLAVNDINRSPDAYREMLVEKEGLPKSLAATYRVSVYPTRQGPSTDEVNAVLDWMRDKGYLKGEVSIEDIIPPTVQ